MLELPSTKSELIKVLWETNIKPLFHEVTNRKGIVDSHRPPTQDDIETYLAKSDNPRIVEAMSRYYRLEGELATYRHHLNELALEELHSPANDDEKKAARSSFNATRNKLIASLHSLGNIAATEDTCIVEWVQSALTQVPKLNTISNNHDLKAMREWLQENHPEANIKSRGTIPLKWKQVYYGR